MTRELTFYFDYTSPFTYLAAMRIDAFARDHALELRWEPAFLGAILKATGNRPPAEVPARGRYLLLDLVRHATREGVPFRFSPHFPLDTKAALRGALAVRAEAPSAYHDYNLAVFRAAWAEGRDVADPAVLAALARAVGVDPAIVTAAADAPHYKQLLHVQTDHALAAGAFGMPFFVLDADGARECYFGNDRLELIDARLRRGVPWPTA
ncbi:MAG: 2-hydroxychromene-2-carboxylate isomerase [Polyangiaceae bacterium]|nr:2-hydroxychromene-2-carboxylate isomerase [Polyangiaceae bacterium]